ncbi:hypothetical protein RI367_000803 [Sorochytrium milnesiophthora]
MTFCNDQSMSLSDIIGDAETEWAAMDDDDDGGSFGLSNKAASKTKGVDLSKFIASTLAAKKAQDAAAKRLERTEAAAVAAASTVPQHTNKTAPPPSPPPVTPSPARQRDAALDVPEQQLPSQPVVINSLLHNNADFDIDPDVHPDSAVQVDRDSYFRDNSRANGRREGQQRRHHQDAAGNRSSAGSQPLTQNSRPASTVLRRPSPTGERAPRDVDAPPFLETADRCQHAPSEQQALAETSTTVPAALDESSDASALELVRRQEDIMKTSRERARKRREDELKREREERELRAQEKLRQLEERRQQQQTTDATPAPSKPAAAALTTGKPVQIMKREPHTPSAALASDKKQAPDSVSSSGSSSTPVSDTSRTRGSISNRNRGRNTRAAAESPASSSSASVTGGRGGKRRSVAGDAEEPKGKGRDNRTAATAGDRKQNAAGVGGASRDAHYAMPAMASLDAVLQRIKQTLSVRDPEHSRAALLDSCADNEAVQALDDTGVVTPLFDQRSPTNSHERSLDTERQGKDMPFGHKKNASTEEPAVPKAPLDLSSSFLSPPTKRKEGHLSRAVNRKEKTMPTEIALPEDIEPGSSLLNFSFMVDDISHGDMDEVPGNRTAAEPESPKQITSPIAQASSVLQSMLSDNSSAALSSPWTSPIFPSRTANGQKSNGWNNMEASSRANTNSYRQIIHQDGQHDDADEVPGIAGHHNVGLSISDERSSHARLANDHTDHGAPSANSVADRSPAFATSHHALNGKHPPSKQTSNFTKAPDSVLPSRSGNPQQQEQQVQQPQPQWQYVLAYQPPPTAGQFNTQFNGTTWVPMQRDGHLHGLPPPPPPPPLPPPPPFPPSLAGGHQPPASNSYQQQGRREQHSSQALSQSSTSQPTSYTLYAPPPQQSLLSPSAGVPAFAPFPGLPGLPSAQLGASFPFYPSIAPTAPHAINSLTEQAQPRGTRGVPPAGTFGNPASFAHTDGAVYDPRSSSTTPYLTHPQAPPPLLPHFSVGGPSSSFEQSKRAYGQQQQQHQSAVGYAFSHAKSKPTHRHPLGQPDINTISSSSTNASAASSAASALSQRNGLPAQRDLGFLGALPLPTSAAASNMGLHSQQPLSAASIYNYNAAPFVPGSATNTSSHEPFAGERESKLSSLSDSSRLSHPVPSSSSSSAAAPSHMPAVGISSLAARPNDGATPAGANKVISRPNQRLFAPPRDFQHLLSSTHASSSSSPSGATASATATPPAPQQPQFRHQQPLKSPKQQYQHFASPDINLPSSL